MAPRIQYTAERLLELRDTLPNIKKPENLPAIEQWIEYVYLDVDGTREKLRIPHSETQQQQRGQNAQSNRQQSIRPGTTAAAADPSPMGSFGTGQRPSLMQTRSSAARSGDDITLGPPRTMFASSRSIQKLADLEKPSTPLTEAALNEETEKSRSNRTFGDKQTNRKSMGTDATDGKHHRESWTSARDRRALAAEEEKVEGSDRNGRYGRRDRDQDGERRNGFGEKQDSRWHREDRRQNGEKQGGWREREKQRHDRDVDGGRTDKKPEWMDDPAPKQQEEDFSSMMRPSNQDEFEKWKRAQHARNKKSTDEPESTPMEALPAMTEIPTDKPRASLKLEGIVDKPFGSWGDGKPPEAPPSSAPTPAKTSTARGNKASKFMPMFAKKDEPKEETPPATSAQQSAHVVAPNGSADDKAGFDRILQMLGNTTVSTPAATPNEPASPQPRQVSNGSKPRSRFTGFFEQTPRSPERLQSPPSTAQPAFQPIERESTLGGRGMAAEPGSMFSSRPADTFVTGPPARPGHPTAPSTISPDPMMPSNGVKDRRSQSSRPNDIFLDQQPPPRNLATPDVNIQNLLATQRNQRQQQQGMDNKNSEFLLGLLQAKGGPGSRPPSQQARPDPNFDLWLGQPPSMTETHAPKPRAPQQPGQFEDQLLRNYHHEPPRQEQPPPMPSNEMLQRRTSQRAPPGFFDEQQNLFQQQQQHQHHQRNFTEPPRQFGGPQQGPLGAGRRMSGHPNLPQMQIPSQSLQQHGPPPPFPAEFLQSPSAAQPPPGFNPHMPRHPPGIHNIPNIFQTPQPQQQGRDLPAGFGGSMGGGGGGMTSPPVAPPGFYGGGPPGAPPGFMQMRSPVEGMSVGGPGGMRGNGGRGYDGFGGLGQGR